MKKQILLLAISTLSITWGFAQSDAIGTAAEVKPPKFNTLTGRLLGGKDMRKLSQEEKKAAMQGASENFGGFDFRLFKPSARIFFDTGSDDAGEIDIFKDGNITATIDIVNLVYRWNTGWNFPNNPKSTLWYGLSGGLGISAPADDSDDGTEQASNSPILLTTIGGFLEYDISTKTSVLLEAGYAWGITSDESFGDKTDGAIYVGLSLDIDL
jgi:hypothetical protein